MLKYFEISNQGVADFNAIRLVGFSSKRDKNLIGQFGSGSKYALALLSRMGIFPTFFISDDTRVDTSLDNEELIYTIRNNDTVKTINSNIHRDFGIIDWNDPWFAIRDLICNAIDEGDYKYGFSEHQESSELKGTKGRTTVFIPINNSLISVIASLDAKFKLNNNNLFFNANKFTLSKSEPYSIFDGDNIKVYRDNHSIYKKGVFVADVGTYYSYNIDDLKLTESRTANVGDIERSLEVFMRRCCNNEMEEFFVTMFEIAKASDDKRSYPFELKCDLSVFYSGPEDIISRAFYKVFGKDAVYVGDNDFLFALAFASKKTPIKTITHQWDGMLAKLFGMKNNKFIDHKLNFIPTDDINIEEFNIVMNRCLSYMNIRASHINRFFKNRTDLKGCSNKDTNEIAFNADYIGNTIDFHVTVIEELIHHYKDIPDGRDFQDTVLTMLAREIINKD